MYVKYVSPPLFASLQKERMRGVKRPQKCSEFHYIITNYTIIIFFKLGNFFNLPCDRTNLSSSSGSRTFSSSSASISSRCSSTHKPSSGNRPENSMLLLLVQETAAAGPLNAYTQQRQSYPLFWLLLHSTKKNVTVAIVLKLRFKFVKPLLYAPTQQR